MRKTNLTKKILAGAMSFIVAFTMMPMAAVPAYAAGDVLTTVQPVLAVTGTDVLGSDQYSTDNIGKEKAYTLAELEAMSTAGEALYSTINSAGTKRIYRAEGANVSEILGDAIFSPSSTLKIVPSDNPAYTTTLTNEDYSITRYYHPNISAGSSEGAVEVPLKLVWANKYETAPTVPESSAMTSAALMLCAGQKNISDVNNSIFTRNVNKLIAGNEITKTGISIMGKSYTRSEILLLPRATNTYGSNYVVGVPLKELLKSNGDSDVIQFTAADGYAVAASGKTKAELVNNNYMLVYEKGDETSSTNAIYDTGIGVEGYFRLYGDDLTSGAKMLSSISLSANPYKHITNGGTPGSAPYGIDAITGATLTVEGPGVNATTAINVRSLEETGDANIYKGSYTDSRNAQSVTLNYEGVKVLSIVDGIVNTSVAKVDENIKIIFKNRARVFLPKIFDFQQPVDNVLEQTDLIS